MTSAPTEPTGPPRLFAYGTLAPRRPNAHLLADTRGAWEPATSTGCLVQEGWGGALGYPALVLDPHSTEVVCRVVTHASARLTFGEAHQVEHLVDPTGPQAHGPLREGQDLAPRPATVLSGGVEQDANVQAGIGQVGEAAAQYVCRPGGGGRGEADNDAHRGGLARSVGSEEAGDPARFGGEGDVVDGGVGPVRLGDALDADHRSSSIPAVTGDGLKPLTTR